MASHHLFGPPFGDRMYAPDPMRSRPVRLHWAGWETDTYRLQQAGWDLSADQSLRDGDYGGEHTMRIAMRYHDQARGMTKTYRLDPYDVYRRGWSDMPPMQVDLVQQFNMMRHEPLSDFSAFAPIDATPQYRRGPLVPESFDDFAHFASVAQQPKIIIPEESVPELLERILKLQQPERTERLRREIREEDAARPMVMHGQILSFARAA